MHFDFGLSAPATSTGSHTVTWSAISTDRELQLSVDGGAYATVYVGQAGSYTNNTQASGSYTYRVRQYVCIFWSCGYWYTEPTTVVVTAASPDVPTGLSGPGTDYDGAYTVSWNTSSGATAYELQQKYGSGSWSQIYSGSTTSKVVTGNIAGTYYYRVRACSSANCSAWSASHVVTVVAPPVTPGGLSGPATDSDGSYTISWNSSTGSTSYELEEQANSGFWSQVSSGASLNHAVSGNSAGLYSYRVRGCNIESVCSGWSSTFTVDVTEPPGDPSLPIPPAPPADPGPSALSDQIGSISGSFRVSETGEATYSIPIASAAGTAGVAPQISLNYSSGSGNGLIGLGWSLGGLSAISRCRQTYDQDRAAKPIGWNTEDRYCLDGQRLILYPSGQTYGAVNSTYRTEIDSGSEVTIRGSVSGEPDYFEVKREDGSTTYYGKSPLDTANVSAKRSAGVGRTLSWSIRHFADSVGNPIWFDYVDNGLGHRIQNIRWAFGTSGGPVSGSGARLEFVYDSSGRADIISGYIAGSLFENHSRLKQINSYNTIAAESVVREYHLRYGEGHLLVSDTLSRLTSIEECVGSACLPKTTFGWQVPYSGVSSPSTSSLSLGGSNFSTFRQGDIDGDGRMDVVWLEGSGPNQTLKYALSNGAGLVPKPFSNGASGLSITLSNGTNSAPRIQMMDYNMDGRQDIAYYDQSVTRWKIVLAEPYGNGGWRLNSTVIPTTETLSSATFVDIDSDGTQDALTSWVSGMAFRRLELDPAEPDSSQHRYRFGARITTDSYILNTFDLATVAPDFDGDGMIDFVVKRTETSCTGLLQCHVVGTYREAKLSTGFYGNSPTSTLYHTFPTSITVNGVTLNYTPDMDKMQAFDVNADGLGDVLYAIGNEVAGDINAVEYALRVNHGDGTFDYERVTDSSLTNDDANPRMVDWNMDGYPDLLWKDRSGVGTVKARYWNPNIGALDPAIVVSGTVSTSSLESVSYFDINGDGASDIVRINAGGQVGLLTAEVRELGSQVINTAVNRIESIVNGLGAETAITYEPISTSDHYQRLELTTTSTVGTFCETEPGTAPFCYDAPIHTPNIGEFYTMINGAWDLPSGSLSLGKSTPIIEISGPKYVVTDVAGDAPSAGALPGSIDENAQSTISYRYGEAKLQAAGRGFLGFERLTTIDNQSGVETTTRYRQDWPFIGRPLSTEVRSASGNMLSSSTTTWEVLEWSAGYQSTYQSSGSAAAGSIHVVQTESIEKSYDLVNNGAGAGTLLLAATTTIDYDAEANVTSLSNESRDGVGTVLKLVETINTYDDSSFALSESRLLSAVVTTTRQGQPTPLVRESTFSYILSGAKRGLLLTENQEPNQPAYHVETTHSYDNFGNLVRSKVAGGGETRCDVDTSSFDGKGRYVDVERDCLGRATSSVLSRNEFGQPLLAATYLDTNETILSQTSYGALGRPYYSYIETGTGTVSFFDNLTTNCPTSTVFRSTSTDAGGTQTVECVDALGRTVRALSIAFDGTWNAQDTEFDAFGRIKRKSEPFNLTYDGPTAQFWTHFTYDILGRGTSTELPDSSNGTVTYTGLTSVTTNDLGQTKTETKNILGEITDVYDALGGHIQYDYDHQGNLITVTDNAGNETITGFDLLGRKTSVDDPDKGYWQYQYNHFGELTLQTDAKLQTSSIGYDDLGRMRTRIDKDATGLVKGNTSWVYDSAANGLGQLDYVEDTISGHHTAYLYDTLGRNDMVVTSFDGNVYSEKTTYDQYGRVHEYYDTAGDGTFTDNGVKNSYNPFGYLNSIADVVEVSGSPRTIYQQIESMNARGQVTVEKRGIASGSTTPAVTVLYSYWDATGRAKDINASNSMGLEVQDLEYLWNTVGNLMSRKEFSGSKNLQESFGYDDLNRLTSYGPAGNAVTVTYDSQLLGNINTKSDVSGAYSYGAGGAGPHAATNFDGSTYVYDANGSNTSGGGRIISYTTFDKAASISKGGHTTSFEYDTDRSRFRRIDSGSAGTTTTRYVGSVEFIDLPNGNQERKRYIAGVAIETSTYVGGNLTTRLTNFVLRDHLGSVDVITDSAGAIVQEQSFDAWGQRRNATNWLELSAAQLIGFDHSATTRGFTNHEMLDEVGVVNMNGRIYDAKMGRFLQADPFVQSPTNSQSLNRYSYAWNNPLNNTDPSGYYNLLDGIFDALKIVAAAVLGAAGQWEAAAWVVGTLSFFHATARGASFGDALLAGISSAALTYFGGTLATGGFDLGYTLQMGTLGGITNVLQGGEFGNGFLSSGIGAASAGLKFGGTKAAQAAKRVTSAAVIGGTVSELTGGKFANGAATSAFSSALTIFAQAARQPTAQEVTYARLARDVYDPQGKVIDGYGQVGDLFVDKDTGLQSALYVNAETGHSVFAFAGSNDRVDWVNNAQQAFGLKSAQYVQGLDQAQRVFAQTGGNVHFVGHSLGGGLAGASAIVTGGTATIFNAAGVHPDTVGGLTASKGSITHFYSTFDVLQSVNAYTPARVSGEQVSLGPTGFHRIGGVCRVIGC